MGKFEGIPQMNLLSTKRLTKLGLAVALALCSQSVLAQDKEAGLEVIDDCSFWV